MYGKKARSIRRLRAHVDALIEQRDQAIAERDAAVRLNGRLASKLDTAVSRGATQAERRFARASELLRRRAVHDLQRELATQTARADALARRLATLQQANQAADWAKPSIHAAA